MTKLEMIKAAGEIVVSVGVGAIVGNAVAFTTPTNINLLKKVCIGVGSFVLSSMTSDKATEYTEEKINYAAEKLKEMVSNGELN